MFKITVSMPTKDGKTIALFFNVIEIKRGNARVSFFDSRTGILKDFPEAWCAIEEVRE